MLIELLIFVIVLLLVLWLISILPIPATGAFPLRTVLYVVVVVVAIVYLLRYLR